MTTTLTPRQISSYIKKEVLKKYPSITKISVKNHYRNINITYEGGCNRSEMQGFLNQYESKYNDSNEDIFKYKPKVINIDGVDYHTLIDFIFAHRNLTKSQAQTVLDLVKGFADANNKIIALDLSQSDFDGSWRVSYPRDFTAQTLVHNPSQGWRPGPGLDEIIHTMTNILEPTGECITVGSLMDAIMTDINF